MLEVFQKEISIGKITCIYYTFFLKQKLDLPDSIINLKNFAYLNETLINVCDFLLIKKNKN